MTQTLREVLEQRAAFGITLTIHDPFLAEAISSGPFDYLLIDTEHSPLSLYQLQTQLISLRTGQASILVRLPDDNPIAIMQVLDLGAHGIVVPHVESREDCEAVVRAALYAPDGDRGIGPRRAARLVERSSYFRDANQRVFVGIMIESKGGADQIDEILKVPGVGGVMIGLQDMAASLGHLNDPDDAEVLKAVERVVSGCRRAGVPYGMYAATEKRMRELIDADARIISVGSDLLFLEHGMSLVASDVAAVRASVDLQS